MDWILISLDRGWDDVRHFGSRSDPLFPWSFVVPSLPKTPHFFSILIAVAVKPVLCDGIDRHVTCAWFFIIYLSIDFADKMSRPFGWFHLVSGSLLSSMHSHRLICLFGRVFYFSFMDGWIVLIETIFIQPLCDPTGWSDWPIFFMWEDLPSDIHPDSPTSCKDGKLLQQLCAVHWSHARCWTEWIYIYIYNIKYIYMQIHRHGYIYRYAYIYMHICIFVYLCMHTCLHTYTFTEVDIHRHMTYITKKHW